MRRIFILSLALALPALAAPPAFAPVTPLPPGQSLRLPHDFGAHPAYKTEWWYATGWVKTAAGEQLQQRLTALPFGASLEVSNPSAIRALSLQIFDRSFAVTYLLEAIAIVIGLFGVAATFSAQTLARAREFGMLRHVGVTRGQILSILALEGGALTALGIATGFVLGLLISFLLVFIVNPQSFHWTMQLHLPWSLIASVAAALLTAAALTALIAGRQALSAGPIRAVREDW